MDDGDAAGSSMLLRPRCRTVIRNGRIRNSGSCPQVSPQNRRISTNNIRSLRASPSVHGAWNGPIRQRIRSMWRQLNCARSGKSWINLEDRIGAPRSASEPSKRGIACLSSVRSIVRVSHRGLTIPTHRSRRIGRNGVEKPVRMPLSRLPGNRQIHGHNDPTCLQTAVDDRRGANGSHQANPTPWTLPELRSAPLRR